MISIKKKIKIFLRTVYITSVIFFCLFFGFYSAARAYESIRLVGFGEYRKAIEVADGTFRFFDFEIKFKENI